jgi:hypothetical protein
MAHCLIDDPAPVHVYGFGAYGDPAAFIGTVRCH